MQQERIKVGYVDMALGAKTVVHTYLLYTDKNNNQYILRDGPNRNKNIEIWLFLLES